MQKIIICGNGPSQRRRAHAGPLTQDSRARQMDTAGRPNPNTTEIFCAQAASRRLGGESSTLPLMRMCSTYLASACPGSTCHIFVDAESKLPSPNEATPSQTLYVTASAAAHLRAHGTCVPFACAGQVHGSCVARPTAASVQSCTPSTCRPTTFFTCILPQPKPHIPPAHHPTARPLPCHAAPPLFLQPRTAPTAPRAPPPSTTHWRCGADRG